MNDKNHKKRQLVVTQDDVECAEKQKRDHRRLLGQSCGVDDFKSWFKSVWERK